jgi:hypothetical protein
MDILLIKKNLLLQPLKALCINFVFVIVLYFTLLFKKNVILSIGPSHYICEKNRIERTSLKNSCGLTIILYGSINISFYFLSQQRHRRETLDGNHVVRSV